MRQLFIMISIFYCFKTFSQQTDSTSGTQPDILLIVSSGHGFEDAGCYGNTFIKTPNIDKLAREGIRMDQAYHTSANMSSGFAELLTGLVNHASGQYGRANGSDHFSIFAEVRTLPSYLNQAGYRTARIGLYPLSTEAGSPFDTVLGQDVNVRNSYEMANRCGGFISVKTSQPFFLLFCPADPDRSFEFLDETYYGADRFGSRETGYDGIIPKFYKPDQLVLPSYLPDLPESREEYAQYAQAVSRLDLGIGRLLELLHKAHRWEHTVIVYLSVSGPDFPGVEDNFGTAGLHMPLIIKPANDRQKNRNCDAMISTIDLMPTILDLCKILPEEHRFHGRSFRMAMDEAHPTGWEEVYASHTFDEVTMYYPMRSVETRHYKLIWNIAWPLTFPISHTIEMSATWRGICKSELPLIGGKSMNTYIHRPEFELYNLQTDPLEINNQADNPENQQIMQELKRKLKDFQVRTNDPWIISWQ